MDRYQIIRIIHDYMSKKPVLKAWIFGSFARGEERAQSDIDILFVPDFEHGSFTLLTHGGMYEDLKQLLGREVDLVVEGSLRPYAQESVERDKILVYERASFLSEHAQLLRQRVAVSRHNRCSLLRACCLYCLFSYKGNKKAANRKGLAAQDRSVSYFFYGLSFLYILISMGLYFLQYSFQSSDEVIHIFLGQYQWRENTKDVGAGATGEAMLLVNELAANFLVRNIEYGAYH